jgi:hypothetical protein
LYDLFLALRLNEADDPWTAEVDYAELARSAISRIEGHTEGDKTARR